jgi:hypothetical protein
MKYKHTDSLWAEETAPKLDSRHIDQEFAPNCAAPMKPDTWKICSNSVVKEVHCRYKPPKLAKYGEVNAPETSRPEDKT